MDSTTQTVSNLWNPRRMHKWNIFSDNEHTNFRQSNSFNRSSSYSVRPTSYQKYSARCFRCGQSGHFIKECELTTKSKTHKKIKRDNERLLCFLQRKTCESFPFSSLDDSEFRKVTKTNSHFKIQINFLQEIQKSTLAEKQRLETVIDSIKSEVKESRKQLREEVNNLKLENKSLKTKLQKSVSENKLTKYEINILHSENDKTVDNLNKCYKEIDKLRNAEIKYKKDIDDWIFRCRELEDIKITTPIEFIKQIDDLEEEIRKLQSRNQSGQNSRSRGRGRYYANRGRERR